MNVFTETLRSFLAGLLEATCALVDERLGFVTGQDANITGSFLSLSFALLAGPTFTSRGTRKETVLAWNFKKMTGNLSEHWGYSIISIVIYPV